MSWYDVETFEINKDEEGREILFKIIEYYIPQ